ncbi:cysteine-rich receptor-like protein kinase 26 isoform X2 [Arachis stenosperma]|uniref:cysteine-rich receptor-like protein kinase 26 isoform X2 n=1 Tax=Arachis stenosperma TaxID=217475 RepID=UPI0025ACAB84|nr:cysteine-rich receptor-like protein kinase 26 isoform X2 [Arachis stenosperma]
MRMRKITNRTSSLFSIFCCLLCLLIISTQSCCYAQEDGFRSYSCDNGKGNYTANSTYHKNLNTLLSTLISNTQIDYGYYNFSYGQDDNKVNAVGLCQGDLNQNDCRRCLNNSITLLTQLCPNQKEAIGWYDTCMLRYSNRTIFGNHHVDDSPKIYLWNPQNATDLPVFNQNLKSLMSNLIDKAITGDSRRKYAAASVNSTGFQNIYGVAQCTPDLSSLECDQCLEGHVSDIPACCDGKRGGRVLTPSCYIRYEVYPFFQPTTAHNAPPPSSLSPPPHSSSTPTSSSDGQGKTNRLRIVIFVAVPTVIVSVLIGSICIYLLRVRKPRRTSESNSSDEGVEQEIITNESLQFDFDTIRVATDDFSNSNKLGQGGFGAVYKGRLSNGQMIAVKRLSRDSGQGATEFKNEVLLLVKLQHRNLVKLLGFCLEGSERLLVYEFVPNKSLDYFIFDPIKRNQLNWASRYKIIEGVARALLYLHEDSRLRIIHRDLKASNILLDDNMNPKIADFGLARLFDRDQTQGNTNQIAGTYGYMAPEYAMYGQFSTKSDVFSFGVIVLEILSGKRHIGNGNGESEEQLISFVWRNWREGTAINIADPSLSNISPNEIMRCVHIGLLCVQENLADRPNMGSIVLMLNSYSVTLPTPSEPAFFVGSRTRSRPLSDIQSGGNNSSTSNKSAQESENEASITELYPR